MEEHVVVYRYASAVKEQSKVKRTRQVDAGDKLEYLRSELDRTRQVDAGDKLELDCLTFETFVNPPERSEEPEENLNAELDRLPAFPEPPELEESEEAKDLEEAEVNADQPKEAEEAKEPEEAEEHEELKEAEDAKEQKESSRRLHGLINDEVLESETVQAWHRDLFHNLRIVSTPPEVIISEFRDARRLFGVNFENKVTLGNPGHLGAYEEIVLLQFDPNFMSAEVVCRHPSCNNINPAAAKSGKRDLYLCPHHQKVLRNSISDAFAKKSIETSTSAAKPEPGHFAGYTSLISLLDGAYHDAKKFQTLQGKSLTVQEAILNVRNFLIITSTVLNPDEDNLSIALPPVFQIFQFILENREAIECLAVKAIPLLKELIQMILFAFGVIYEWVSQALDNPGAQIGAGVGGFVGGWTSFASGPLGWVAGVTVGSTLGALIGNGFYSICKLWWGQRQQGTDGLGPKRQPHNQYPRYHFNGDVKGRLDLHVQFHQK